jgi:hypothetical protein
MMGYTYRLSRRLAQIHLALLATLTLSCTDSQGPIHDTDEINAAHQTLAISGVNNLNEPTGFSAISNRTLNAKVESGWTDRGDAAFSIISQSTAPASPNSIGQAFFKKGYKGGSGPIATDLNLRGKKRTELYLSFWMKLSSNFYGSGTSRVNKIFHVWADGTSTVVVTAYGMGTAPLMPQLRLQSTEADPRGVSFNLNPNIVPGVKFVRNRWYHVEVRLKANTPGSANGTALWWVDGTLVGSYGNIGYLGKNDSAYWEQVSWAPTWGTPTEKVPNDMYMYMDHIYVSGH